MSRFDRDPSPHGPVVQGLSARGFVIDGGVYRGLLLTPKRADEWQPPALAELAVEHLSPLLNLQPPPEFLLLGTGLTHIFPPRGLVTAIEARGIGLETMDSRAAARTWGMLRGEGRWVAAALMPLS